MVLPATPGGSPAPRERQVNVPLTRNNDLPYGFFGTRRFGHRLGANRGGDDTVRGMRNSASRVSGKIGGMDKFPTPLVRRFREAPAGAVLPMLALILLGPTLVVPITTWHHHEHDAENCGCSLCAVTYTIVAAELPAPQATPDLPPLVTTAWLPTAQAISSEVRTMPARGPPPPSPAPAT